MAGGYRDQEVIIHRSRLTARIVGAVVGIFVAGGLGYFGYPLAELTGLMLFKSTVFVVAVAMVAAGGTSAVLHWLLSE